MKPTVKNSKILSNTAPLGGGIYIDEFYNEFREQLGKIDIRIINTRIENNLAEYGGGIWIRDSMGELRGVTVCNNRAVIGGGVHIEHNPMYFKFSSEYLCNVYMNFARMMGNDLFRLNAEKFPIISFTIEEVKEVIILDNNKLRLSLAGPFECHGKTKVIMFDATLTFLEGSDLTKKRMLGDLLSFVATFDINLTDFGIRNVFVPDRVADKIDIAVNIVGTNKEPE